VALYVLSLVQVELKNSFIDQNVYEWGAYLTFAFSILSLLISKYDEIQVVSESKANESKKNNSTNVDGQNVAI
jgi:hypothetical protein